MTDELSLETRDGDRFRHLLQSRGIGVVHHLHDVFFVSRISRDALCVDNVITEALKVAEMTA